MRKEKKIPRLTDLFSKIIILNLLKTSCYIFVTDRLKIFFERIALSHSFKKFTFIPKIFPFTEYEHIFLNKKV